mmetsp:Transcript_6572/g.18865  ORF Transcript_6572/g.18865 Transcript_6572/m.18865 type:complete len:413 (+) Transcript_6572:196-1434(+)
MKSYRESHGMLRWLQLALALMVLTISIADARFHHSARNIKRIIPVAGIFGFNGDRNKQKAADQQAPQQQQQLQQYPNNGRPPPPRPPLPRQSSGTTFVRPPPKGYPPPPPKRQQQQQQQETQLVQRQSPKPPPPPPPPPRPGSLEEKVVKEIQAAKEDASGEADNSVTTPEKSDGSVDDTSADKSSTSKKESPDNDDKWGEEGKAQLSMSVEDTAGALGSDQSGESLSLEQPQQQQQQQHRRQKKGASAERIDPGTLQGYIVDLPGYGYGRAPTNITEDWQKDTQELLLHRRHEAGVLQRLFLLMDARRGMEGPNEHDRIVMRWLEDAEIPFTIVLTKADRVSVPLVVKQVNDFCLRYASQQQHQSVVAQSPVIHVTSSARGWGIHELMLSIETEFLGGNDEEENDAETDFL